ncbi:MAG: dicarboxylate/amino acid:cation symporter [Pirellula sp.]
MPKISLTSKIFIGLFLGILIGWLVPPLGLEARPLSNLFLNLIKSIIAPLIFATLVVGISGTVNTGAIDDLDALADIAETGDIKQVGRIGAKAFLYFEVVTTLALFIGLIAVNIAQPGKGLSLASIEKTENKKELSERARDLANEAKDVASAAKAALQEGKSSEALEQNAKAINLASEASEVLSRGIVAPEPPPKPQSFGDIIAHLSPTSIIKAMAEGDVLQIVVFSVLFALAVTSIGKKKSEPIVKWCESLADVIFRFT